MAFSIRCPACRQKFPWQPTSGFPDECPNPECSTRIAHDRADDDVVMPFLRSGKTSATDQVFRQMEAGSEIRAAAAAEMTGAPVSEMSGLKITDLNSSKREGDIAAKWNYAAARNLGVTDESSLFKGSNGVEYSGAVQAGPFPNAGAHMRTALHSAHAQATGGNAVSDVPALETQQAGYRRRG